ncbi:hypothetical protein K2173_019707 [Erythroxylum novogranatense]|uniref:Transmembrane protein n=1 Tax=Erythroxylum novogranatense TaxID=1862640 RepID=A0AAV8SMP6_9ROSI|nr:hypothetical protein K2173_019707 [Erythroxylum novogranatense]
MREDDMSLRGFDDLELPSCSNSDSHRALSKQWSLVVLRHDSSNARDDLSVFPPINHENLTPSTFDLHPDKKSLSESSTSAAVQFSSQDADYSSSSTPSVPAIPRWWGVAFEVLRSKVVHIGSYVRCNGGGGECRNGVSFKLFGNVAFAAAMVVGWWLSVRVWRRRDRVEHLLRIIVEKDEKILKLLNQIVQMNEVLLSRQRALTS